MLMCMCMLTKRTNILFSEEIWKKLLKLANEKNMSIGEFIRAAVEEKYDEEEILKKRKKAFERILEIRPKPVKGRTDYKALINEGRKVY